MLKRFGIDFCCGGGKTLGAACQKKGIALDDVAQALASDLPVCWPSYWEEKAPAKLKGVKG